MLQCYFDLKKQKQQHDDNEPLLLVLIHCFTKGFLLPLISNVMLLLCLFSMLFSIEIERLIIINEGSVHRRLTLLIIPMPPAAKILELVFQDETLWAIFTGVLNSKEVTQKHFQSWTGRCSDPAIHRSSYGRGE